MPRKPWEVGLIAFEIARRHRFTEEMATLPADIEVHVMPAGSISRPGVDLSQLRYRDSSHISGYIERAYQASSHYLAQRSAT